VTSPISGRNTVAPTVTPSTADVQVGDTQATVPSESTSWSQTAGNVPNRSASGFVETGKAEDVKLSFWDGANTMLAGLVKKIPVVGQCVCLGSAALDLKSLIFNKGSLAEKGETLVNLYQNLRGAFHFDPSKTNPAAEYNWAQGQGLLAGAAAQKLGLPVPTEYAKLAAAMYGSQWVEGGLFNPAKNQSMQKLPEFQM
jgi:hypothetical protein